jgi:hypothetical protein
VLGERDYTILERVDYFMTSEGAKELRQMLIEDEIMEKYWGNRDD